MSAPIPDNEEERLAALQACNILDTAPEESFDRIARLAAQLFGTPMATVSLVDEDRQYLKSVMGLNFSETPRSEAFCAHTILDPEPLVVLDAQNDPRFQDSALVRGDPGIRFYCGAPLETADGFRLGAVCVIDTEPRTEAPQDLLKALKELAAQASAEINNRLREERLADTATALITRERELEEEKKRRQDSETRAELALEAGRMGSWEWDRESGKFAASILMHEMFGVTFTESRHWRNWFKRVHAADRKRLLDLARNLRNTEQGFSPEFRIHVRGVERWMALKGRTERSARLGIEGAKGVCWDVTERRLHEERLRESEEIFRGLSVASPVGIFQSDLQGQITYANPRMQEMWGMGGEALQGTGWISRLHPEDAAPMMDGIVNANGAGKPFEREYRLLRTGGELRWVHGRSAILRDVSGAPIAVVGTVDDISERKRLEEEQHNSQELTRRILESSADSIKVLDLEGRLLLISPAGVRALGVPAVTGLVGKSYFELWEEDRDRAAAEAAFEAARSGGRGSFQRCVSYADGERRWWDTTFTPIVDKSGRTERILAVSRDMTEFYQASEEQARARQLAEEANQAKNLFLANVSHELRTPLNGVLASSDILLASKLNPEQLEMAQTIKHSGQALLHLVDDLLDLGRMEGGKLVCRLEPFELRKTVELAVALVVPAIKEKGLKWSVTCLGTVPDLLMGDEGRIQQIVINYLNNARKFTEQGSISLHISVDSTDGGEKTLLIAVHDTGPGIPEQAQHNLFQPFKQVDGSTTRKHGGLGLGLAISARLAETMGGTVGVQSTLGEGSTFWVKLPLTLAPKQAEAVEAPIRSEKGMTSLQVLVAEDNPINQKVTMRLLEKLGCQPDLASNGEVAVDMFRQKRYDLVLMDCQMPQLDGYEATRQIREMEGPDAPMRTPIVALTAHGMAGDRERCLSSGMNDHLVKPLSLLALKDALERWSQVAVTK